MKTKIVEMPFLYNAQIIPYRSRRPVHHFVRDKVLVQIPDLTAEEAPLGIEWVQNDLYARASREDRDRFFARGVPRIRTRFHDGRHYGPMLISAGEPLRSDEFARDAASPQPSHTWPAARTDSSPRWNTRNFPVVPALRKGAFLHREMSPFHFDDLADTLDRGRLHEHDKDDRIAEAADFLAKSLIFVDGEVWSTSMAAEMWYGVTQSRGKPPELFVGYKQAMQQWTSPFRADRFADALSYAEHLAQASGTEASITGDEVIIHTADSIVRDDIVMLASQVADGAGMNYRNGRDGWPGDAAASHIQLHEARMVPEGERDRSWAARVLMNAEIVYSKRAELAGCVNGHDVCEGLKNGIERWLTSEQAYNLDIVMMMEAIAEEDRYLNADQLHL